MEAGRNNQGWLRPLRLHGGWAAVSPRGDSVAYRLGFDATHDQKLTKEAKHRGLKAKGEGCNSSRGQRLGGISGSRICGNVVAACGHSLQQTGFRGMKLQSLEK